MATPYTGNRNGQAGSDAIVVDLTELFRAEDAEGKSVSDLVAETGLTEHQVRHKLRSLVEAGQVECAGRKQGKRMDGVTCQLPVYRWIGDKAENL